MTDFPLNRNSYQLLNLISEMEYQSVYVAHCTVNGFLVIIKIFDMEDPQFDVAKLRLGTSLWRLSEHENLEKYYGSFQVDNCLWIVSEFLEGGSFKDILQYNAQKGFRDETLIASILEQVLIFLQYFHKNNNIHRDIRTGNILVSSSGSVKVGDLGSCVDIIRRGSRKLDISPKDGYIYYSAPELHMENSLNTEKVDIWSLGIVAYELSKGETPFSSFSEMVLVKKLVNKDYTLKIGTEDGFSQKFSDFIRDCLCHDHSTRPSAEKLLKSNFIKLSKGKKYVETMLMTDITPIHKRLEVVVKTQLTPQRAPAPNIKFILKGENTEPVDPNKSSSKDRKYVIKLCDRFLVTFHDPDDKKKK